MKDKSSMILLSIACFGINALAELPIDRRVGREPIYQGQPAYGLIVFDAEAQQRVWMIHDGEHLWVDKNGNGDLTDEGEKVLAEKPEIALATEERSYGFNVGEITVAGQTHKGLTVSAIPLRQYRDSELANLPAVAQWLKNNPNGFCYSVTVDAVRPRLKGGGLDGCVTFSCGPVDLNGLLRFAPSPADAPIIHLGKRLELSFYASRPTLRVGHGSEWMLVVGSPGVGPGTFAAIDHTDTIPKHAYPAAEVTFPSLKDHSPIVEHFEFKERCCGINLYGWVRVPSTATVGVAKVRLTFDQWIAGNVAPTSFDIMVLPAKSGPKLEPVSSALIATLPHPERLANVSTVTYSLDGQRLFIAGYPSGVIQFWNVETREELYRIETPRGYRNSADYALLTSDWKMLYVPTEDRKAIPSEQNGQKLWRFEFSGLIRRWDLTTRSELDPLVPPAGHGNEFAMLIPDQQLLLSVERMNRSSTDPDKTVTVLWNLKTGQRQVWADGFVVPKLSADRRRAVATDINFETKSTVLTITTFPERKVLIEKKYDGVDGRVLNAVGFSPDGKVLACELGGKKGAKPTILFLDPETLAEQGRWIGAEDDDLYGWAGGQFTPDGRRFLMTDGQGVLHVWNVATKRVERTVSIGQRSSGLLAISPSGRWLATAWMPKRDPSIANSRKPDPQDLPQPRITFIDLTDAKATPITLIAPQGYVGSLAFRPGGQQLAFGSAGGVHLFDLAKLGLDQVK